jgi:Cd2+/Zn2+-exporting ATPase
LTGESTPDAKLKGDSVLAGMININRVVDVKVTTSYKESKLSRNIRVGTECHF